MPMKMLDLEATSDDDDTAGGYVAYFVPTMAAGDGAYMFMFNGSLPEIAGAAPYTPVSLDVTCGRTYNTAAIKGMFDCPEDIADYQFPTELPDLFELQEEVNNATSLATSASTMAQKALALANQAMENHNMGAESPIFTTLGLIIAAAVLLRA